jgi:hypothetical protein
VAHCRRSQRNTVMSSAPLEVERFESAENFLRDVGPWLLASEAENSVLLSIVHLLAGSDHPFHAPFYLAAVKQAGRIVGCAVRPPPDQLDLTALPPGAGDLLMGGGAARFRERVGARPGRAVAGSVQLDAAGGACGSRAGRGAGSAAVRRRSGSADRA